MKFKLAILQTKLVPDKYLNIKYISESLVEAGENGANICVLGQCCNSPYNKQYLIKYAQDFQDSETLNAIKQICKKYQMYAIGSLPRKKQNKIYNTCFVVKGEQLLTQMDKIHLFDIDRPGIRTYKQSDIFTRGQEICTFQTQYCSFGIGICYDIRFSELALAMMQKGARVLVYTASFNWTNGPLYWETLLRGRAIDTQCYTVGVNPAQYKEDVNIYQSWGHSMVVDPFGRVLKCLDQNPHVEYCEIDPELTEEARLTVPLRQHRRKDLYSLQLK